jgi:uncharacterized protein (TIGR02391 family)
VRDAHLWLQQIGTFTLTIKGRDRARGWEVIAELPDPDEDDGRMIAGSTLELIARDLGDTFLLGQLRRFFVESSVPEEFLPYQWSGDKWNFCLIVLAALADGGGLGRRTLRQFVGGWLCDRLLESPSEAARTQVVERLNRQGWHIKNGVLVIGERTSADPSATIPLFRDARVASLHPQVRQVAASYLESGHHAVAIFAAFKEINSRVKELTGLDLDGTKLMGEAVRDHDPPIRFGDLTTQSGRDVQAGLRFMFMGVVSGLRNPDAHEQFRALSEEEAFEELGLASMLMRRLDGSEGHRDRGPG